MKIHTPKFSNIEVTFEHHITNVSILTVGLLSTFNTQLVSLSYECLSYVFHYQGFTIYSHVVHANEPLNPWMHASASQEDGWFILYMVYKQSHLPFLLSFLVFAGLIDSIRKCFDNHSVQHFHFSHHHTLQDTSTKYLKYICMCTYRYVCKILFKFLSRILVPISEPSNPRSPTILPEQHIMMQSNHYDVKPDSLAVGHELVQQRYHELGQLWRGQVGLDAHLHPLHVGFLHTHTHTHENMCYNVTLCLLISLPSRRDGIQWSYEVDPNATDNGDLPSEIHLSGHNHFQM